MVPENVRVERAIQARLGDRLNAREFAEYIGRPHGTVKRWLTETEGLPHRKYGSKVVIDLIEASKWVQENHPPKEKK